MNKFLNFFKDKGGFTMIEILVAVSIFSLVVIAPTGFLINSIKIQQKALSSQELIDNTSYFLEYLSRALRMAKKDIVGNCITPIEGNYRNYSTSTLATSSVKFLNYKTPAICQEIFLEDGQIKESRDEGASSVSLTAAGLEVISFKVSGEESWGQDDNLQPKITIFLEIRKKGNFPAGEPPPQIKIQTTVSQRDLDVAY